MKQTIGFVLLLVLGYFIYRRVVQNRRDPLQEHLEEQAALQEIGFLKADVRLRHEVPIASVGELPFAGTTLTALSPGPQNKPKPLVLQPKGFHSNPYDSTIPWN